MWQKEVRRRTWKFSPAGDLEQEFSGTAAPVHYQGKVWSAWRMRVIDTVSARKRSLLFVKYDGAAGVLLYSLY
jgi:hypothetical protein